jgi:hypothetical protein
MKHGLDDESKITCNTPNGFNSFSLSLVGGKNRKKTRYFRRKKTQKLRKHTHKRR